MELSQRMLLARYGKKREVSEVDTEVLSYCSGVGSGILQLVQAIFVQGYNPDSYYVYNSGRD